MAVTISDKHSHLQAVEVRAYLTFTISEARGHIDLDSSRNSAVEAAAERLVSIPVALVGSTMSK